MSLQLKSVKTALRKIQSNCGGKIHYRDIDRVEMWTL